MSRRMVGAVLLVLVALGGWLRLSHMDDIAYRTLDELTYTANARRILERGFGEFPALIAEYNRTKELHIYPPPTRAAYLVSVAATMRLSGITDERAGAWLSCIMSVASLVLFAVIGFRHLPPLPATYGMLCLSLSLPDLVLARRCWQDAFMGFLGLLLVWAACEITRDHRKWWAYALLVGVGSFSILMKEISAFVYGGCGLYVMVVLIHRRAWRFLYALLLVGGAGAAASFYVLVSAAGSLDALTAVWRNLGVATLENPYQVYLVGPWYRFIWGFWIFSPLNLMLCLFAVSLSVLPKHLLERLPVSFSRGDICFLRLFSWITVLLVMTVLLLPGSQNFRYLAPVFGPMYLMGGFGLWSLMLIASRKMHEYECNALRVLALAAVVGCALWGYLDFERKFVVQGVPDLAIKLVIDSRN